MNTLKPEDLTVIIDTREQRPFVFPVGVKTARLGLTTGDYSLAGLTRTVAFERKSLDDLANCCGRDRKRMSEQVQRLLGYQVRGLILEGTRADIEAHKYRADVHPNAVLGSLLSWENEGLPVVYATDRDDAARLTWWKLWLAAKRRFHEIHEAVKSRKI